MQTSCIWTKIGWMSGGKSIDPCCVPEIFISARQKSNLGAQQRPTGQRCSAWFVHLQFAPKKVSLPGWTFIFFLRFISILIPKTRCPERIYGFFFSARFWCIFNCNQARWSKHVGWFFWDWCAPMFFLEDGNTWKMFRICRIGGVCHPKSALMPVDFPCQACEAWTWQAFGIRRAGAHCCLYTSCFDQLVSLPWQCVKLYVFVTCLCVNLSSSHFTVMILTFWPQKSWGPGESRAWNSAVLPIVTDSHVTGAMELSCAVEATDAEVLYTSSAPQWLGSEVGKLASR